MHQNDTPRRITTDATHADYVMALCRAIGRHLDAAENLDEPLPEGVPVEVPYWRDAGAPWTLVRVGTQPKWHLVREGDERNPTAPLLRFGTQVEITAAVMLQTDQRRGFTLQSMLWPEEGAHHA